MADTFTFYTKFKEAVANGGGVDLNAGNVKVALLSAAYTPDQDAHEFFDDITGEIDASGEYTAGGETLANPTISTASHNIKFDADDLSLTGVTTSANIKYLIIYNSTGTASTSRLVGYITLETATGGTAVTVNITWNANGVLGIE